MQVIVHIDQLKEKGACSAYLRSPEWISDQQALVYPDWGATVSRLLSTRAGVTYLSWLVGRGLVPMTQEEFAEARKAHANG
jgi:hypothetical protein